MTDPPPKPPRSHADDMGRAIEYLTALISGDSESDVVRTLIHETSASPAEAAGVLGMLARVTSMILAQLAREHDERPEDLLARLGPRLHADAYELDHRLGPPLPGSAILREYDPPAAGFLIDELTDELVSLLATLREWSHREEDEDEATISDRRKLFELLQSVSIARDLYGFPRFPNDF